MVADRRIDFWVCNICGVGGTMALLHVVLRLFLGLAEWIDLASLWAAVCLLGIAIPLAIKR